MTYVKFSARRQSSWHLAMFDEPPILPRWLLMCGREAPPDAETRDGLPEGQRTCEACWRADARQREETS